jgi:hypothetical protein
MLLSIYGSMYAELITVSITENEGWISLLHAPTGIVLQGKHCEPVSTMPAFVIRTRSDTAPFDKRAVPPPRLHQ